MKPRRVFALLCALALTLTLSLSVFATGEAEAPIIPEVPSAEAHEWDISSNYHRCRRPTHNEKNCNYSKHLVPHKMVNGICIVCGFKKDLPNSDAAPGPASATVAVPSNDPATWVVGNTKVTATTKVYSAPSFTAVTGTVLTAGTSLPVLDWTNNHGFIKASVEGNVQYVTITSLSTPLTNPFSRAHNLTKCTAAVFAEPNLNSTVLEYVSAGTIVTGHVHDEAWFYDETRNGYIWGGSLHYD